LAIKLIIYAKYYKSFQTLLKLLFPVFYCQRTIGCFTPELKAQSLKLKVRYLFGTFSFELSTLSFSLVEVNGFEPMTFPLDMRDALSLSNPCSVSPPFDCWWR